MTSPFRLSFRDAVSPTIGGATHVFEKPLREGSPRVLLLREVAPPKWDVLLRGAGLVGLAAIVLTALVPVPVVSDLATFFALALFINGPYSPVLPVAFEPVLIAYGRIIAPSLVAAVGVSAQLLVEYLNYHLYDAALRSELLRRARNTRLMGRILRWYQVAPFLTTVLVAFSPLPYWTVRITAPLSHYPMWRHLSATALGRLPRLWMYAALGTLLPFSSGLVLGVGLGVSALIVVIVLLQRRARAGHPRG